MRTIIAGSRHIRDMKVVERAIAESGFMISTVLSGDARGVDKRGEWWARNREIPVEIYPADWERHGNRAGIIRNEAMARKAEALIAVWDGKSRGTQHMIHAATERGLKVHILNVSEEGRGCPK